MREETRRQRRRLSAKVARHLLRLPVLRAVPSVVTARALRCVWPRPVRLELLLAHDQHLQDQPRSLTRLLGDKARFECRTDDVIPRRIYEFGVWEPFVSAVALSLLGPGDTFVDVGANVGYYSVLASSIVGPTGQVISIEPMPEARVQLERNRAMNGGGESWQVVAAAVAPAAGEITLYRGPGDNLGRSTTIQIDDLLFAGVAHAAPLAELVDRETLAKTTLIKIDIEGDELTALRGLLADVPDIAQRCNILVELTPKYTELRSAPIADIWRALHEAGFRAYAIPNGYDVDFYMAARGRRSFTAPRLDAPPLEQTDVLLTARDEPAIEFAVPVFRVSDASTLS